MPPTRAEIKVGDRVRSPEDHGRFTGRFTGGVVVRVVRTPIAPGKASHEDVYVRWAPSL